MVFNLIKKQNPILFRNSGVVNLDEIWDINKNRHWVKLLLSRSALKINGKDLDTINYWVNQINLGSKIEVIITKRGEVQDGNHRLVAAFLYGLKIISYKVV